MTLVAVLYANFHAQSDLSENARYFYENLKKRSTGLKYDLFWLEASPEIPALVSTWPAVKKIFHFPENQGRDFGMWGRALGFEVFKSSNSGNKMHHAVIQPIDLSQYDYFLFLNKSCYGPNQDNWLEQFVEAFKKFPKAAVVGAMACAIGGWHIQTWAFMLSRSDLQDLLRHEPRAFGDKMKFHPYWVFDSREVAISQYFLKKGKSIYCFLKNYPEIYLDAALHQAAMIDSDPNYGMFREGLHGNLSKKQNLVFVKNTLGK